MDMKKPKRTDLLKRPIFKLTREHLRILDEEHYKHVNGLTKSYTREESMQIIRGEREY
jgi:hypothetical protein